MKEVTNVFKNLRKSSRLAVSSIVIALLIQASAFAQITNLKNGARVKVFAPEIHSRNIIGTIYDVTSSDIFLSTSKYNLIIPIHTVEDIWMRRHTTIYPIDKAALGLIAGGIAMGVMSLVLHDVAIDFGVREQRPKTFITGFGIGVLFSATILITNRIFTKKTKWDKIPLNVSASFLQNPSGDLVSSPALRLTLNLN